MKKNKAAGIMKLLKQGYAAREIKDRMAVSESYIYAVKKQMAADKAAAKAAAEQLAEIEAAENLRPNL